MIYPDVIGPSHPSQFCSEQNCIQNGLDLAPSLYIPFGGNFTYVDSLGVVHAAHGGIVHRSLEHPCRMEIAGVPEDGDPRLMSRYTHVIVEVENLQRVEKGHAIGLIERRRLEANCACDPARG